jgi:hypothetical protein
LPELVPRVEHRLRYLPSRATRTPYEEDLSDRELTVLRLLATDLTQREIGEALYVSFKSEAEPPAPRARRYHEDGGRMSGSFSARRGNGAHSGARPDIEQFLPANRPFGLRASNPRAEVRSLPGPSRLFMGDRRAAPLVTRVAFGSEERSFIRSRPLQTA